LDTAKTALEALVDEGSSAASITASPKRVIAVIRADALNLAGLYYSRVA
jgi:hypothetical protein